MAASSSGQLDLGGSRVFSGEDEDGKEYRRWKTWVSNKILTFGEKMPAAARGAYVYTMLSGKALEAVEHLEPSEYQKEGGEDILLKLLDVRFPTKDTADELSENLTKIFELRANEGETLKAWISRATEAFELLKRKTQVSFPEEARGWMILNRSGLTAEQRAIVLARSLGSLQRVDIGRSMRSCYPDFQVPKRKSFGAGLVADEPFPDDLDAVEDPTTEFDDVEQFLAENHDTGLDAGEEAFEEEDVREILAVTWQEKRKTLNRLQKQRKFHEATNVRRAFRVEVEELKKKTKCHRCHQVGHWSRECKNPPAKGAGKGSGKGPSKGKSDSGAAVVEEFIASVSAYQTMMQKLRDRKRQALDRNPQDEEEQLLVSSPGFGVLDSGCGKTIVGETTYREFVHLWQQHGFEVPKFESEVNHFRFGNGSRETSHTVVSMPVVLAGRRGFIRAAIVKGNAPLLISRGAMKTLNAQLDFGRSELRLFSEGLVIPLKTNAAGQFVVYLLGQVDHPEAVFQEVMQAESPVQESASDSDVDRFPEEQQTPDVEVQPPEPNHGSPDEEPNREDHSTTISGDAENAVWSRVDQGIKFVPITGKQGPRWHQVHRRRVVDVDNQVVISDEVIDHSLPKTHYHVPVPKDVTKICTEFHFRPQEQICSTECLPVHHLRQVEASFRKAVKYPGTFVKGKRLIVAEVFSPPRMTPVAESMGFVGRSYDLLNGFDFRKPADRDRVKKELREAPPDLLVLCPPCTHEGGWWNLNSVHLSPLERLRIQNESRMYIRFCCELFQQQVSSGRRALFEHPKGARTWSYDEVMRLIDRHFLVKCHMCRFGLRLPNSNKLIRKSTNLLVSHEDMKVLGRLCPGSSDAKHTCHDVIAGSHPQVGSVSRFAGQYSPDFVEAVLRTVPQFARATEASLVQVDEIHDQLDVFAASRESLQDDDEDVEAVTRALTKLHKNLGHPSNTDLVRILKHGQASETALKLARQFDCDFCKTQARPHIPLPAQTSRVTQFNQVVGIDVKHLPGWKPNQKVKALNIVDQSSCYQQMLPFYETETAEVLKKLFAEYWVRWTGPPDVVLLDQAQTMTGENLQGYLENMGSSVRLIAAEAHWQLGRTESHGGWFGRILQKIIDEHSPRDRKEWEECVRIAHVKNQCIQSHGYTPHQHVFGKNPTIPGDLLSEPMNVVSGTASLSEDHVAKAQAIRCTARKAVVAMQDDKALRTALAARPRFVGQFHPGDLVAYWRQQKVSQGKVEQGGRWHGVAVIIGNVGRNVLIAHRRQVFRCAPEQIRPATTEEKTLIESPEVELLGIKDMIEGGTFKGRQYVDLVPGRYPTQEQVADPSGVISDVDNSPVPFSSSEAPAMNPSAPAQGASDPTPDTSGNQDTVMVPESPDSEQPSVPSAPNAAPQESSSYGPVRRRVTGKSGDPALFRPPAMKESDFLEMMQEVVPRLIDKATQQVQDSHEPSSSSSSSHGTKRNLEVDGSESVSEPPAARARASSPGHDTVDECLSVEEILEAWDENGVETFMAAYLQKKMSKEIPPSGNDPDLQKMVDESKTIEWETLLEKGAIKIHYGRRAHQIKENHPDRFMGSRFVIIRKATIDGKNIDLNDESTFKIKSRWCLQGHLDPDLDMKAMEGALQSPTLSQMGRMVLMQVLASNQWTLQLGDIKGAFMEAGPLPAKYRPLYANQPRGGIPGVPSDAVLEIVGNVYGQNDAPQAWYSTFDSEALSGGWIKSKFDSCLYYLRDENNKLIGIMGVHVDDTAIGGKGAMFEAAVQRLKKRFPYRKWRVAEGEFCGAFYSQNTETFEISMSQSSFAEGLKPATISKGVSSSTKLSDSQVKILRGINGSLNWLASQSRPDLAVQTSLSQQCFPNPTIKNLRDANNAVRRAKQHKDLCIRFQSIDPDKLTLCCHSDAAWANVGLHTQAGYIIGFTHQDIHVGKTVPWTPAVWRSYKMPRAVSSTLSGEAQAMATAGGTIEWLSLLLSEALDGPFNPMMSREVVGRRSPIFVVGRRSPIFATDCKSLYDHLVSPSSPTSIDDRRTSIDVVIIRESLKITNGSIRWLPTNRMIADGLTKDKVDPADLLRACIRKARYQISPEETVLQQQAEERSRRQLCKGSNAEAAPCDN